MPVLAKSFPSSALSSGESPPRRSRRLRAATASKVLVVLAAAAGFLGHHAPAKAYDVFFNAPNVLGGIRNVWITLPSTGVTGLYDVILKQGTLADVYGTPPVADLDTASDAQALMEASANGINAYLNANIGTPLYFAVSGEPGYVIPYGSIFNNPGGDQRIGVSISVPHCIPGFYWDPVAMVCRMYAGILERAPQITPVLGDLSPLEVTVWTDVQPVPGPLPLAGGVAAWGWARTLRRRCAIPRSLIQRR
jgi:hypothetical protein